MQGAEAARGDPQGHSTGGKSNLLSSAQTGHHTEKMKKNGRKLNSGVPAKILIGRNGPNIVIQGNQQQVQLQQ